MSDLRRSWVESANAPGCAFPLNNLPYGVFSVGGRRRCGVAIGDMILDATGLEAAGILRPDPDQDVLQAPGWNPFMALGKPAWSAYRAGLVALLSDGADEAVRPYLVSLADATLHMPFHVSEFTDFYASRHHATHVGTMFRGAEHALPPNWLHMPIGYNGRASSVVVSGTDIIRPHGQIIGDDGLLFAPSERFDFELEMGAIVGQPSRGPLSVAQAFENIFGYVLLNDWSARDIQAWEYQPLGPFQGKATATSISPWIVTAEALEVFRCETPAPERPLLDYLRPPAPMLYDIALEAVLTPEGGEACIMTRTNLNEIYYSSAQQLAHHTSSGCPMRVGDLLGSGTISGPEQGARGSMLELTWGGAQPLTLEGGAERSFLDDGDRVTLSGFAQGNGFCVGFGDCTGTLRGARV
ncbi:MAG: fumarylacetoacetase [Pseudomonadota bacterium]